MPLTIELTPTPTDEARSLVEELEAELSGPFTAEQRHGLSLAGIFQRHILFFIARLDGQAVGCGGIALQDGLAEVKRMYVRPDKRGQNVGRALLAHLEAEARARGIRRMVLETGDVLERAIHLYTTAGFTPCAPFGDYALMPPPAIQRSVFLEKQIG